MVTDAGKAIILLVIIFILYKITMMPGFSRTLNRFIEKRVIARGIIKQQILEELFRLPKGYGIAQSTITKDNPKKGFSLAEAGFIEKDILVLSIERKHGLIPFPHASDAIEEGDRLLCYGLLKNIEEHA